MMWNSVLDTQAPMAYMMIVIVTDAAKYVLLRLKVLWVDALLVTDPLVVAKIMGSLGREGSIDKSATTYGPINEVGWCQCVCQAFQGLGPFYVYATAQYVDS